jgi:hypothetical protein
MAGDRQDAALLTVLEDLTHQSGLADAGVAPD